MTLVRRVTLVLLLVLFGTFGFAATSGAQERPSPEPAELDWAPCLMGLVVVECASLDVPLDYEEPTGQQLELAVRRLRSDPADGPRLGSLVLNPGGPGVSARGLLEWADTQRLFPGWDLVAPDPRGVGDSQRLTCSDSAFLDFPVATGNVFIDTRDRAGVVADACLSSREAELFGLIGTVNVARDFDRLRAALGESRLDYYGASYGTHIGAVYAELFPDRVGRFVLDGPVLLDDRTRVRIGQIRGNEDAFDRFDAACAASSRCPLQAFGARSVWRNLRWQLSRGPIPGRRLSTDPSSRFVEANLDTLYAATSLSLYQGRDAWVLLADALFEAAQGDGSRLVELAALGGSSAGLDAVNAAHLAITCSDDSRRATAADAQRITTAVIAEGSDLFAVGLGSLIGECQSVPISPALPPTLDIGFGDTDTMLVIAATHDPATPYAGAQHFVSRIRSTRLLTVADDGHTMVGRGNRCVDDAVLSYLSSGVLPAVGAVCEPTGGFLGIVFSSGGPNGGIVVDSVVQASAADGLFFADDELLSFNGEPLTRIENGATYDVALVRDGERINVTVVAGPPVYWLPG